MILKIKLIEYNIEKIRITWYRDYKFNLFNTTKSYENSKKIKK